MILPSGDSCTSAQNRSSSFHHNGRKEKIYSLRSNPVIQAVGRRRVDRVGDRAKTVGILNAVLFAEAGHESWRPSRCRLGPCGLAHHLLESAEDL